MIDELRTKYPVKFLCAIMDVNRSGYYKWKARQGTKNRYETMRIELTQLLSEEHRKHPSYGYHRLAYAVFKKTGWIFSHNLAHKCCKYAGIRSAARGLRYKKPGEESVKFGNAVKGNWNATGPLQIVVSDMTMFKVKETYWEWTLMVDTYNNEIIAHSVTNVTGSIKPYYECLDKLNQLAGKKEEQKAPVILHTDQGAVYSSRGFEYAHKDYNIFRSMSRGGTPTDNPIIEALNGWMKEELYVDYDLAHCNDVPKLLDEYVRYFNEQRLAAALDYKSPIQYRTESGF